MTGKSLTFAKNTAAGVLPGIMQRFVSQKDGLDVPIKLASDMHVVSPERCFLAVSGVTLSLANARSLGDKTEVSLSEGAMLDLYFKGDMRISKLYLDGKLQPAGTYSAANTPKFIKGKGVLKN